MAYNPISGNNLTLSLAATAYTFGEWTYTIDGGIKKYFAAGSFFQRTLPGGVAGKITAKGTYDAGNMALAVGTVYAVILGIDSVLTLTFTCSARLASVEYHNVIESGGTGMSCTIELDTDGSFTLTNT